MSSLFSATGLATLMVIANVSTSCTCLHKGSVQYGVYTTMYMHYRHSYNT